MQSRNGAIGAPASSLELAVICDYAEEQWPSMDLVAEMLLEELGNGIAGIGRVHAIRPALRRRAALVPLVGRSRFGFNADRLWNRFWDYPRYLRRRRREFGTFHICDHSYAHLVHELPSDRTGVFCHDLDAFRCLLSPSEASRPLWFKALARRILHGLQSAAVVFYSTSAVRREMEAHGLVDPSRLVHAPYGIAREFTPDPPEGEDPEPLTLPLVEPFLLHVGSCIPRKRIDVLLDVFAAVRDRHPHLSLVHAGGAWTESQSEEIERRGLGASIVTLPLGQLRATIAELYRRASLVLLPSEAEGFGLPVVEALACGASVVASDIPVLREVGGDAATFCPVGDVPAWVETVDRLLRDPAAAPAREERLHRAARYSWAEHTRIIAEAYGRL